MPLFSWNIHNSWLKSVLFYPSAYDSATPHVLLQLMHRCATINYMLTKHEGKSGMRVDLPGVGHYYCPGERVVHCAQFLDAKSNSSKPNSNVRDVILSTCQPVALLIRMVTETSSWHHHHVLVDFPSCQSGGVVWVARQLGLFPTEELTMFFHQPMQLLLI